MANKAARGQPAGVGELSKQHRHDLIEAVADFDDAIMHLYLDEKEPTEEQIMAALGRGTVAGHLVPVLCGAALRNRGVQPILDAVVDYLPSPADVPAVEGTDPKTGTLVVREHDDSEPFSALAFKIQMDPQGVGKLTFFRVPRFRGESVRPQPDRWGPRSRAPRGATAGSGVQGKGGRRNRRPELRHRRRADDAPVLVGSREITKSTPPAFNPAAAALGPLWHRHKRAGPRLVSLIEDARHQQ